MAVSFPFLKSSLTPGTSLQMPTPSRCLLRISPASSFSHSQTTLPCTTTKYSLSNPPCPLSPCSEEALQTPPSGDLLLARSGSLRRTTPLPHLEAPRRVLGSPLRSTKNPSQIHRRPDLANLGDLPRVHLFRGEPF